VLRILCSVSKKELKEFQEAKPGDYCVFPCSMCGVPVEGEWDPNELKGTICSDCAAGKRLGDRTKLLEEALPHLPAELQERIKAALAW